MSHVPRRVRPVHHLAFLSASLSEEDTLRSRQSCSWGIDTPTSLMPETCTNPTAYVFLEIMVQNACMNTDFVPFHFPCFREASLSFIAKHRSKESYHVSPKPTKKHLNIDLGRKKKSMRTQPIFFVYASAQAIFAYRKINRA